MVTVPGPTQEETAAQKQNEATVQQLNAIVNDIQEQQPLLAPRSAIAPLAEEYAGNIKPGFIRGIADLAQVGLWLFVFLRLCLTR